MAIVRKKQDDKILKLLREIVTIGGNKQCFDCRQKGNTYVNMTIGTFVCTTCSGILRGLTPPHRVKSISMATFTQEEIDFIKSHGNDECTKTWLGLWDPKRPVKQDHREFMIDKYERKRYYLEPASPLKSLTTNSQQLGTNGVNNSNNSNHSHTNGSTANHKIPTDAENLAALKAITLTPPTSVKQNKLNKNPSELRSYLRNQSNSNGNLNQYPINAKLFAETNSVMPTTTTNNNDTNNNNNNNNSNNHNTSSLKNVKNGFHLNNNNDLSNNNNNSINIKNGFHTNNLNLNIQNDNINDDNNKFTPDAEFVADFSSANIFTANSNLNNSSLNISNNNLQNISQNLNLNNNNNNVMTNGVSNKISGSATTTTATSRPSPKMNGVVNGGGVEHHPHHQQNGQSENFADFDHNPIIYNAAANNTNSSHNNNNFYNNFSTNTSTTCNNNNYNNNNFNLSSSTTSSPLSSSATPNCNSSSSNNNNNSSNIQWNIWQQFQWPYVQPEQNRWSLPMSISSSNSISSGCTSVNSTPTADRYAALKDLDEQLRDTKIEKNDVFNTVNGNTQNGGGVPNPFKSANPFQQTQQPQQQQQQLSPQQPQQQLPPQQQQPITANQLSWSPTEQNNSNNNFFSSPPLTNGYGSNLINTNIGNGVSYATNGFYVSNQQHVSPYGQNPMKTVFGNPFMTAATTTATSKTNNPFL